MNIINPSVNIIPISSNPQKHIEEIARTCYKSNDLITEDSNKTFITNLFNRKHWAMLEHFIFIYEVNESILKNFIVYARELNISLQYMKITNVKKRYIISFSARTLLDLDELVNHCDASQYVIEPFKEFLIKLMRQCVYDYKCHELFNQTPYNSIYFKVITLDYLENNLTQEEFMTHGWKSVKFICDRGVSHEIVRHRDASYAQESTRYCNYSKEKFGNEITIIKPIFFDANSDISKERQKYDFWEEAMREIEHYYFYLLNMGVTPQEARAILPNSLKTEVIMTARNYEYVHFFELRCDKAAHPQMRELAIPLYHKFCNDSAIFNNYVSRLNILDGDDIVK